MKNNYYSRLYQNDRQIKNEIERTILEKVIKIVKEEGKITKKLDETSKSSKAPSKAEQEIIKQLSPEKLRELIKH